MDAPGAAPRLDPVPLRLAARTWFGISLQTFGGPAGQIAVMQRVLVDELRWIGQQRFLHALNFCMLLPGPEAQQLAIYTGWLLNGVRGGLVAGTLFVLPGVVALLALSGVYVGFGDTDAVQAVFVGLAPAVIAIVLQAVIRVSRRAVTTPGLAAIALSAFVALAVFAVAFPVVVLSSGVLGWVTGRLRVRTATMHPPTETTDGPPPLLSDDSLHDVRPASAAASSSWWSAPWLGGCRWLLWRWFSVATASSSTRRCSSPALRS